MELSIKNIERFKYMLIFPQTNADLENGEGDKMRYEIDVKSLDRCGMCFKEFKIGDEVVSLCLYDEMIEKDPKSDFKVGVKEAYQLAAYHKKCSPLKINKAVYKEPIGLQVAKKKDHRGKG